MNLGQYVLWSICKSVEYSRYPPFTRLMPDLSLTVFFICVKGEVDFTLYMLVIPSAKMPIAIIPEKTTAASCEAILEA